MKMRKELRKVLAFLLIAIMVLSTNMSVLAATSEDFLLNTHAKFQTALDEYEDNAIFTSNLTGDDDEATPPDSSYEIASLALAKALDPIAVVNGEGFDDLQDAIDAAGAGDTVEIIQNYKRISTTIKIDKEITIDFNGCINRTEGEPGIIISDTGSLTIVDSTESDGQFQHDSDSDFVHVEGNGALFLKSGMLQSLYGNISVALLSTGSVEMTGGELRTSGTAVSAINKGMGRVAISGGRIDAGCAFEFYSPEDIHIDGNPVIYGGFSLTSPTGFGHYGFISGGTYDEVFDRAWLANGYSLSIISGTKDYKVVSEYAASVGEIKFGTIQEAIKAAGDGDVVKILKDVEVVSLEMPSASKLIIDLYGNAVTVTGDAGIYGYGMNLTIKDSLGQGRIESTSSTGSNFITVEGSPAFLTVESGILLASGSACVIRISGGNALVTINGGKMQALNNANTISGGTSGFLTVTGGTIGKIDLGSGVNALITGTPEIYEISSSSSKSGFISGGTFHKPIESKWLEQGYKVENTSDGKYKVVAMDFVASVGGVQYETIQEAIDKAENSATITILKDVEETSLTILSDDKLTIDLSGKVVTLTDTTQGVSNEGDLTIKDSGKNGQIVAKNILINVGSASSLTVESGTLMSQESTTVNAVTGSGTIEIAGGEIISNNSNAMILGGSGFRWNVTGGTIGNILVFETCASASISGNPLITGISLGGSRVTLNDCISGGTFINGVSSDFLVSGYTTEKTVEGYYKVVKGDYTAAIGDTYYKTIQEAINAATDGATVNVLKDSVERLNVPEGKKLTLDLNGCTVTSTDVTINQADVIIKDSKGTGKMTTDTYYGDFIILSGGSLTVNSGTLQPMYYSPSVIKLMAGTININGGHLISGENQRGITGNVGSGTSALTITSGTIEGGISVQGNCTTSISGTPTILGKIADSQFANTGFITGGTFDDNTFDSSWLADGYILEGPTGDGYYTAIKIEDGAAAIGNTQYRTIQEAINAATDGATVNVLKDSGETISVPEGKKLTLNLNGCTVTSFSFTINQADVIIEDRKNTGKLTTDTYYGDFIILNGGSLTVNSGILQPMYYSPSVIKLEGGTININGGHLIPGESGKGISGNVGSGTSALTITSGTIEGGISVQGNCTTSISGTPTILGKIADSQFANTGFITGGTFDDNTFDKTWLANGYILRDSGNGKYTVELEESVAAIGDTKYATIQQAINAASAGDTITILKDVEEASLTIQSDDVLTINLNGKTIAVTGDAGISNKGNLTILDLAENGQIKISTNNSLIHVEEGASLTVESGILTSDSAVIVCTANNGTIEIKGGHLSGNPAMVINGAAVNLSVTGGTIGGSRAISMLMGKLNISGNANFESVIWLAGGTARITGKPTIEEISLNSGYNLEKFIEGGTYKKAIEARWLADNHLLVGTSDSSNTYSTVLKNTADEVTPVVQDAVSKYKDGTIYYPTVADYTFAGWYTDSACGTPLASSITSGDAYAKFVKKDSVIRFLGGSLKKTYKTADGNYDFNKTDLRFGYNLVTPGQTTLETWGWNYKIGTDGTTNYRNGDAKIDGYGGMTGYISNLLITGIPYTAYTTEISSQLTLNYRTADGTAVTVTEDNFNIRSVKDVATSIAGDTDATDDDRAYAQEILDSSAK